ncbi:MAG: fumarate hydratase [Candidatus Izemoplasmatales bacterium]|nr:fumarate hydratase [Candidatus Izemoplasmatales bacterium]
MMRSISKILFIETIKEMFITSAISLDKQVLDKIRQGANNETSTLSKSILESILENHEIAKNEGIPLCQDTGIAVVFLEIGNQVFLDFDVEDAVNEAVRLAYEEGYLRKSVVLHPLNRKNTLDNTPAIIHTKIVGGDTLSIHIAPKGAGSENMSRLAMLSPSAGIEGVKKFVLETVLLAGGKPCPPIILGIGIGGNFEKCAILAKEAIFRPIEDEALNPIDNALEKELLELVNGLNVGPMGLGGKTTCLAVKVNSFSCHIASLPVAVNIQCHSARKSHKVL